MRDSRAWSEWRAHWPLPFVAALGASVSTLYIYSMGAFMRPLQEAFGWGRAEVSSGILIASGAGALFSILVGMLVDRVGPRKVGLSGVALATGAFALLGTATGSAANWLALWALVAVGACLVLPTIWASAVSTRFDAMRGLALGITLCGAGIGASVFPLLGTWLITKYGWRIGFAGLGGIWAALVLPLLFLFFRGANDGPNRSVTQAAAETAPLPGLTVREGLTGAPFYKLMIAGGLYSLILVGLIVHLVPILEDRGVPAMAAAAQAGLVGIFSVVGRLGTGALLDRLRSDWIGAISFLLPTIACALLLTNAGGTPGQLLATGIIGLSVGSELGVVTYLATRHFGLRRFGILYGAVLIPMAIGTASGPVVAGFIYDHTRSYTRFLELAIVLMVIGALSLASLGRPPVWTDADGAPVPRN